ncbi:MAG: cell wall hydrolase [Bacillota bacterium]
MSIYENKRVFYKLITYSLIFTLLFPIFTGLLFIQPVYASDGTTNGLWSLFKGLFMLLGFSFLSDKVSDDTLDDTYQPATQEEDTTSSGSLRLDLTQSEIDTFAKIVHAEARGEPFMGQVGVAAVVINRVLDSHFPNTITDVIYQQHDGKYAFSAVWDGQIYLEANENSYEAVDYALNGFDPSRGSLYYYNPVTATDGWIFENTEEVRTIGNHVFSRLNT